MQNIFFYWQCRKCISPDCQSNAEKANQFTTKGLGMVGTMVGLVGTMVGLVGTMVGFTMVMVSWAISLSASTFLRHHSR